VQALQAGTPFGAALDAGGEASDLSALLHLLLSHQAITRLDT
jgi:hypothetical protein